MVRQEDTLLAAFSFWLLAGLFLLLAFNQPASAQDLQDYTPPPMFGGAPVSKPVQAPAQPEPKQEPQQEIKPPAQQAVPVEQVKPEPIVAPPAPVELPKSEPVPIAPPPVAPPVVEPAPQPRPQPMPAPILEPVVEPKKQEILPERKPEPPPVKVQPAKPAAEPVQDIDKIEHAPANEPILEGIKNGPMPTRPKHVGEADAIIFERGQTVLEQAQITYLEQELLPRLNADKTTRLRIVAFATPAGEEGSSDRRISLSRAMNIRDFLKNAGIPTSRITLNAFGSATDKSPIDRVDLIFLAE